MKGILFVTVISFFILSIILFLTRSTPLIQSMQGFVQQLFQNPLSQLYFWKQTNFLTIDGRITELEKENNQLKERLIDQVKTKQDNIALRSQFENNFIAPTKLLLAEVIGFDGSFDSPEMLIINKGENDGVQPKMAVIVEKNLVGVINKVTPYYSQVLLVNNKHFKTIGKVINSDSIGIITGQEDFIFFDQVAITDSLKKEDIIVTKGDVDLNGIGIPADLIIGKVSRVSKKENKPFQTAQVALSIRIPNITHVFIIKLN